MDGELLILAFRGCVWRSGRWGELPVKSSRDESLTRAARAFDGHVGYSARTWRGQGGSRPKPAPQTATADAQSFPEASTQAGRLSAAALGVLVVVSESAPALAQRRYSQTLNLLRFHTALKTHKYRWLYFPSRRRKPGPNGPASELIRAIVELKQRNPRFGCPRIAEQLAKIFGIEMDKDVVRRVPAAYYRPEGGAGGPSLAHAAGASQRQPLELGLISG